MASCADPPPVRAAEPWFARRGSPSGDTPIDRPHMGAPKDAASIQEAVARQFVTGWVSVLDELQGQAARRRAA